MATDVKENSSLKMDSPTKLSMEGKQSNIKLSDLKVADLKMELEKRDLDKTGVKAVLVERLKNHLVQEGENPDEFSFCSHENLPKSTSNGDADSTDKAENVSKSSDTVREIAKVACDTKADVKSEALSDKKEEVGNGTKDLADEEIIVVELSLDEEEAQLSEDNVENTSTTKSDSSIAPALEEKCEVKDPSAVEVTSSDKQNEEKEVKSPISSAKATDTAPVSSPKATKNAVNKDKPKSSILGRQLWVSGLATTTRAADLKLLFSKQGRVSSVKIVKSTKHPGKCYGHLTMGTSRDASKAIQNLHRTELNCRTISVERANNSEPSALLKKSEQKIATIAKKIPVKKDPPVVAKVPEPEKAPEPEKKPAADDEKPVPVEKEEKIDKPKPNESDRKKKEEKKTTKSERDDKPRERDHKSRDHRDRDSRRLPLRRPMDRPPRGRGNFRGRFISSRRPPMRSKFNDYHSDRDRFQEERMRRDRDRRERERSIEHRLIERKQREEALRLEREKDKLRMERELLERERLELVRLEREKQKLEREKLEREKEELRRQMAIAKGGVKRPYSRMMREEPVWESDTRKKVAHHRYETSSGAGSSSTSRNLGARAFEPQRERPRQVYAQRTDRYAASAPMKPLSSASRADYGDLDSRREAPIRSRDEAYVKSDYRDRDSRSFQRVVRAPVLAVSARREDWRQERRAPDRSTSARNAPSSSRRMNYF